MNIRKRLDVIWSHAGAAPRWRYIPRHNGMTKHGWNVFDRKTERFLTTREVKEIPVEMLDAEHPATEALH